MPEQPKKLDAKSTKILEELEQCMRELGDEDFAPPGFEVHREQLSEETPAGDSRLGVVPLVGDEEYFRLKGWLTSLAEADRPVAFSAVLQVWLDVHGIGWPGGVFKTDTATYGSGVLPSELGREAARLRALGKTSGEIAQKLIPEDCETPQDRERASDRVRLAAEAFKNGVRREKPIEGTVAALVWRMLAVRPERILEKQYRDLRDSESQE